MSVRIGDLLEKFPDLLILIKGSLETQVQSVKSVSNATAGDLIFISSAKHLKEALETQSQHWVVHKDLISQLPPSLTSVLASVNPQLAMARLAKQFFPQNAHFSPIGGAMIHPSAQISPSAKVGVDCIVGPGAVIGDECTIGSNCVIGANSVIEPKVKIGERTHIHPLVFIGHSCEIGNDCEIQPHTTIGTEGFGYAYDATYTASRITHYGRVILEDGVHIGAGVQIDRGTFLDSRIGANTKIDNHSHFAHNIEIGHHTIIPAGMITAGSARIGNYCLFGGRVTVGGHLEVPDKTKVSAMSVIGKTIAKAGEYGGFPLQEIGENLKTRVAMRNLPDLVRQVRQLVKHLGLKDAE